MQFIFSKIIRILHKIPTPLKCYAGKYLPESSNALCDCLDFCKYGPTDKFFILYKDVKIKR